MPLAEALAVASPLPFFAAELMPDLFTSLLALAMGMLILVPDRLSRGEQLWVVGLAAFTIAAHLSGLPLAAALLGALLPLRGQLGAGVSSGPARVARAVRAVMPEISFAGSQ